MLRAAQKRLKIARYACADVYASSGNSRYFWPYRLNPVGEATPGRRRQCLTFMLDSGFNNDDETTNSDLIEAAEKYTPTFIIPNDVIGDPEATAEEVADFFERADAADLNATPLIPIQPPHQEHYRLLQAEYPEQARHSHFCLGGMRDWDAEQQIAAIRQFREAAGWNCHVHALGLGGSLTLIREFRETPQLIDSLDLSTADRCTTSGKLPDKTWEPCEFKLPQGESMTTIQGTFVEAVILQLSYMLSPLCDDSLLEEQYPQTTLAEVAQS